MVDESARKSFVQDQEFLALKEQKRAAERNTLPNIDWNDEHQVSSLKQHPLQVSGGKAALIARVLRFVLAGQGAL